MPAQNPFSGRVAALPDDDFPLLSAAVEERRLRARIGCGTLAEAAELYRPDPRCPRCGSAGAREGRGSSGLRRWRCPSCGRRYGALSGTVLEHCRKDLPTWARFLELMMWNVPLDACAEMCGVTHKTAFEWRHRVFETVDGYQARLVLRDRVWIDETYVDDTDLEHGPGQSRMRGLSRQKVCIAVAIDVHKNPLAVVCGHGKPSSKRVRAALGGRIATGSVVVHDRERAHGALVRESSCVDESYKADVRDPVYLEAMAMVNSLCSWIKRYMWRFTGMSPKNIQSYLNWYVYLFRVKRDDERWPKLERVVRHLVMTDASFRSLG